MENNQIGEDEYTQKRSFGFMEETPFLLEVVEDIERAYSWEYKSASDIFFTDEFNRCFEPGRLVVLCGNSAELNHKFIGLLVQHLVFEKLRTCAVFSTDAKEFARLQLSLLSIIDIEKLRTGGLLDGDWSRLTRALGRLNEAPLYLGSFDGTDIATLLGHYVSRCADQVDGASRCPVLIEGLPACDMKALKALAVALQLPIFVTAENSEHADVELTLISHENTAGQAWNGVFSMRHNGCVLIAATEIRVGK